MSDRVAIVGSRAHPNLDVVRGYVRSLPPGTVIISGGAEGVDSVAVEEALLERDAEGDPVRPALVFSAEAKVAGLGWGVRIYWYGQHGLTGGFPRVENGWPVTGMPTMRCALMYRNTMIVAACTRLVAFPDGSKGGTWDSVREAKRFRRPVEIRYADGRVETKGGGR